MKDETMKFMRNENNNFIFIVNRNNKFHKKATIAYLLQRHW